MQNKFKSTIEFYFFLLYDLFLQKGHIFRGLSMDMAGVAQLVRAPVCGTGGRGFESHHSPHILQSFIRTHKIKSGSTTRCIAPQAQR